MFKRDPELRLRLFYNIVIYGAMLIVCLFRPIHAWRAWRER